MAERSGGSGVWLFLAGVALAAGLVLAAAITGDAMLRVKAENQTLEVKGFAERRITSDLASWSGSFAARAPGLRDAHTELERQRDAVLAFVSGRGLAGASVEVSPVYTEALYRRDSEGNFTNSIEAWQLRLSVEVKSEDIDGIAALARDSTSLVKEGIALSAERPQYFYTKLGDLKVAMLGEATADARRRADALATNSSATVGALRSARQGVFQITPAHSTDVSDYGQNDTSARDKSIKAVVTVRYAIEP